MARSKFVARTTAGAGIVSFLALFASTGHAAWPDGADLKDPANWPNDPDWGYKAAQLPKDRHSGQWHFYGFQPDRSPNAPALRPAEVGTPSGISTDRAWRVTIGDPRVTIAILDSGPKWDERDIANKAFLNVGELGKHKPKKKDGSACKGAGEYPDFDCNGDGAVSVADWADDPSLVPAETMEGTTKYPQGDKNHNGILDAGDLILNFSDGVDDDQNGYVDDISGWDFLMDDNDPYEDTRFYHGSNQAKFAAAETNNAIGGAGVCPQCRFIPLRVGDSFIADSNDFGQATAYAADIGASAVECALGTINLSPFAQRAVEYAWEKGTIVTGSMADENSKHHNMPNTANYVFSAHAIVPNGSDGDVTSAQSFLCFDPGTNYGGNNYVSTSTGAASSGAAGINSGVVGLMQSAARKHGKYPLSPGEILQLFTMTADDIDVPESRDANAKYYWSQPGFDQRFGYGRTNAGVAVEWIRDGKIPPEVNIVEPLWFENLYKDRIKGPVEIQGTISAKRATSYDYVVEWGPGVQPLDAEFKKIPGAEGTNIDGKVVTGASAPLAQLDLSTIDPKHERDKDSQKGENDNAITVRIRVKAHYPDLPDAVPGEYRRTYYVWTDPDLLPGFPIKLRASLESSPKLVDVDGDGKRDVVQADSAGLVHAWKITSSGPVELPGFPFKGKKLDGVDGKDKPTSYLKAKAYQPGAIDPEIAREAFFATVAVADVDGDKKVEIAATSYGGTIHLLANDGTEKPGWPVSLPYVPSCPLDPTVPRPEICMDPANLVVKGALGSPVLIDMNKDGKLDVVQAGFDGKIYVFAHDGTPMPGWPVALHYDGRLAKAKEHNRILTTPAVADLNGDGIPEILTGSNEKLGEDGGSGAFYVIDGRGTNAPGTDAAHVGLLPNWPVTIGSVDVLPMLGEGTTTSGAFGDFDGDGKPEAIFHGNSSAPMIAPADPGKQATLNVNPPNLLPKNPDGGQPKGLSTGIFGELTKANKDTMFPLFASPSIGDLDLDGTPDVIAAGGSLSLVANLASKGSSETKPAQFLVGMWNGKSGDMFPASPMNMEDYMFVNNQAIVDLSGDGFPEVVTGTGAYLVRAFDACGREAPGFPKNTGQWVMATTAVGDLDGDGTLELVVGTRDGWLYAWHTKGKADGVIQWESWHHDAQNTGNYATKLDQGVVTKAGVGKLDCSASSTGGSGGASGASGADAAGPAEVAGGCSCEVAGADARGSVAGLAGLAGLVALIGRLARRRRG